ncbi:MAG TPA: hypothetical protein VKB79_30855 [Bryobacteraceae bacterium]|nr:hypothetical protein [Bryobacteraceae bacterium]
MISLRPAAPSRVRSAQMDLSTVFVDLYESELNWSISCIWDSGWDVNRQCRIQDVPVCYGERG